MNITDTLLQDKISKALDNIRPYLLKDGGDVEVREITNDMIVKVHLTGACESCAFSYQTLRAGIEMAIKHEAPEIKSVEAV